MLLKGSCHCKAITFSVESDQPCPFNLCFCSICRKTQGGGGYAINLGGNANSLKVEGTEHISIYQASIDMAEGGKQISNAKRHFCAKCGSGLWLYDSRWPDLIHPFASAIDTELPMAPNRTYMMTGSKSSWIPIDSGMYDNVFESYPDESLADWHLRHGIGKGSSK
ncbi:GFA family protein [Sneathiella marina]|uniref:GFA family protein n=1 Tax=Sneathiella marina TaxID=2950108 RepID=A0ABY4VZK1_9PROT|nr:GFA family protein [Sneathiella marina]USG60046.1 GFA family protein [Sneathiella marina]